MEQSKTYYENMEKAMASHSYELAMQYKHEMYEMKERYEKEEIKRVLWKIGFTISFGCNVAWWWL